MMFGGQFALVFANAEILCSHAIQKIIWQANVNFVD